MTDRSTCLNPLCGARVPYRTLRCPKCGRPAFGDDEIARRGRHVLSLGLILTAIMGGVFAMLASGLAAALGGNSGGGFRGSPEQAWLAILGFGSLLAFGIAMAVSGLQMITRGSSRFATIAGIALFTISTAAIGTLLWSAYGR